MCRIFFIFHHVLSLKEMNHILSKRTQQKKDTPFLKNERDDGPHNDGFGIALQKNNHWKTIKKNDLPMLKEIQESNIVVIHLRRDCHLVKKCKIGRAHV